MKIIRKITNGILLVVIGILHTQLAFSPDGFGKQIKKFSESGFFKISSGMSELPATIGKTNFEVFAAFWFFYFGILIIPLGLLVHYVERKGSVLPHYFTISYLVVVLIGSYMVPNSGMTIIMLPHAIFMVIFNFYRVRNSLAAKKEIILS